MPRDRHQEQRVWLLQRQCALSPRQFALAYGLLCVFSFIVAAGFIAMGVWQILIFSSIEMSAVACAFIYHARHAADMQRIVLCADCLLVESLSAGRVVRARLDRWRTRVLEPERGQGPIVLEAGPQRILLGAMVSWMRRSECARELRAALDSPEKSF